MIGIYKIENKITHQVYIGQSIDIMHRWKVHTYPSIYNNPLSNGYNYKLYSAFREYGLENFNFSVIEECSYELLNEREKYWIKYYDSYMNGYNMTIGGQGVVYMPSKQKVYIYDKFGNFIQEFSNVRTAAEALNLNINNIYAALHKKSMCANYQWSYTKVEKMPIYQGWNIPVIAYNLSGKKIAMYSSIQEAIAETPDSYQSILTACKTEKYSNIDSDFQWRFAKDYKNIDFIGNYYENSPSAVTKYTLEGTFVQHYCRPVDALYDLGIKDNKMTNNLVSTTTGAQKSFMGFLWTKYGAPPPEPYCDKRYGHTTSSNRRVVQQFSKEDYLINEYESAHEAARQINKPSCANHITECCQGKRKTCEGYKWKYKENDT